MTKLLVRYDPKAKNRLLADADIEPFVAKVCEFVKQSTKETLTLLTSQELVVEFIRIHIKRGAISCKDVRFLYNNTIIFPDKNGSLDWWPKGFCDYRDNTISELLEDFIKGE